MTLDEILGFLGKAVPVLVPLAGGVWWTVRQWDHRKQRHRAAAVATQDLIIALRDIGLAEAKEYDAADSELSERGVPRSGIRISRHVAIAQQKDRDRQEAVRQWMNQLIDLRQPIPDPPLNSRVVEDIVVIDGLQYMRTGSAPVRCGWCGRLVYQSNGSWWCPEHEFKVS